MNHTSRRSGGRLAGIALGLILLTTWVAVASAVAGGVSKRLKRQVSVMEAVLSEVLIESPNLLVSGGGPVFGVYLEEFGVVFGLEASLVETSRFNLPNFLSRYRVETDDGGLVTIYIPGDEDEDEDYVEYDELDEDYDDEEYEDEGVDDATLRILSRRARSNRRGKRDARRYEGGKEELLEALIDYGETLSALSNDQSVAIAAYLTDSSYFRDRKISRLVIKAKMSDLRANSEGKLSEEKLLERIVTEEY